MRPSEDVHGFVNDAAYRLVRAQEDNMVLKPWVLLASLLLQNQAAGKNQGVPLGELIQQAVWLRDLCRQFGAFLHWPGTAESRVQVPAIDDHKLRPKKNDHFLNVCSLEKVIIKMNMMGKKET